MINSNILYRNKSSVIRIRDSPLKKKRNVPNEISPDRESKGKQIMDNFLTNSNRGKQSASSKNSNTQYSPNTEYKDIKPHAHISSPFSKKLFKSLSYIFRINRLSNHGGSY